jgi:hypothetical protein
MQRTHADPAHRHPVAGAGSRRPRVLPVLVAGVLVAACVRVLLVESFVASSDALPPAVQPGDRVLVWKAGADPLPRDVVVVDTSAASPPAEPAGPSDTVVARSLGAVADVLGVRTPPRDQLAVVAEVGNGRVGVSAPTPTSVPADDVVGVVGLRFWPLDRLGPVSVVER